MPESELRLLKRCTSFMSKEGLKVFPHDRRGIYVLYHHRRKGGKDKYDVVYVGMARAGIGGRLRSHLKKKGHLWTHFSAFEVWDNISDKEIAELEGLFRHIYRRDTRANILNIQRSFKKLRKITNNEFENWL